MSQRSATISTRPRLHAPLITDLAVAVVAFALTLAVLHGTHGASRHLDPLGAGLAALACFPLLGHRRSPLAVFALTTGASAALAGLGYGVGPPFGPTVALFYVATDDRTRSRIAHTAAVVLGMFAVHIGATAIPGDGFPTTPILFGVLVWGGAWLVGDQVRQRRQRLADLVERAERSQHDLERERRLAAAEERTRIARDLHDSAAHAINVILVQAGAARLLQDEDPDAVRAALATIEDVARETIGDIDHLVRTLREESAGTVEPPVGLAALDTLVGRQRAAGQTVEVRVEGVRRPLPPGIDQAAYRILQESLTNAARHSAGPVAVELAYRPRALELSVANPLPPHAAGVEAQSGHGILGMRERASLVGGHLEAGVAGGRFLVTARLPLTGGGR
ncbi:MAG TPA: histidine kinase [Gaiellales bacterium]|nr:histidine kinase [Gaiellales bacterium]